MEDKKLISIVQCFDKKNGDTKFMDLWAKVIYGDNYILTLEFEPIIRVWDEMKNTLIDVGSDSFRVEYNAETEHYYVRIPVIFNGKTT